MVAEQEMQGLPEEIFREAVLIIVRSAEEYVPQLTAYQETLEGVHDTVQPALQ